VLRPDGAPPPRHRFLATGDAEPFARLGRRFLGPQVNAEHTGAFATVDPAGARR